MDEYSCTLPEFIDDTRIELKGARHPLLKEDAVPIDFRIGDPVFGVVITGPNTGGKTVSLKTIGLMILLAQSGIPVPAASMKSCIFHALFADIGDESSIEQSLSTFSSHMGNIRDITRKAGERSIVLIDELGAGTDPMEGSALGTAILDYLVDRRVMTAVTTHFSFIKLYAIRKQSTEVASMEFDTETCRPTYRLVMGVPGRSNALEIAQNLGLEDEILKRSREYVGDEARSMDTVFKNLARIERDLTNRERDASRARAELEKVASRYREGLQSVKRREEKLGGELRQEFSELLSQFRGRLEASIKHVREEKGTRTAALHARKELQEIEDDFDHFIESLAGAEQGVEAPEARPPREVEIGDFVTLSTVQGGTVEGKVVSVTENRVTLQAGALKLTADRQRILSVKRGRGRYEASWDFASTGQRPRVHECDIRGMRFDEAMEEVTRFIDNAVLNNLQSLSIIHGLGTGALREGVQELLKNHRDVTHFEYAHPEQGGYGCTLVTIGD
jgi:DNA mismatch repair protein MutS2